MTLRFATARSFVVAFVIAGLVAGCAPSITVRTDFHPGTNFSAYRTVTISDSKTELDPFIAERIRLAVAGQLAAKGISRVPSDGDLVVHAHVRMRTDTTVSTWSGGWGYGYYGGNYVDVRNVRVGTLVVDLVDRVKGRSGLARNCRRHGRSERDAAGVRATHQCRGGENVLGFSAEELKEFDARPSSERQSSPRAA